MPASTLALLVLPVALAVPCLWIWSITRTLKTASVKSLELRPARWDSAEIRRQAAELAVNPLNTLPYLPPVTGRRYIIVGGSGFVGGWIVRHLLLRGENPKNIRIVNRHPPTRKDAQADKTGFISADISNADSVRAAFTAEWPSGSNVSAGITVFHTAASMRFYERQTALISRSSVVSVDGTRNVLAAAQAAGVDILIYTSSTSIALRPTNFWILPWQKCPETMAQVLSDDTPLPKSHDEFVSNYPYTKSQAEKLVHEAHNPEAGFRTGVVRPGAGIYGRYDGHFLDDLLSKTSMPNCMHSAVQSTIYVENASYAHLLYESRLLESQSAPPTSPVHKLGGQAFMVTDGPHPVRTNDLFLALTTLTNNRVQFPVIPVGPILPITHLLGLYHSLQARFPRLLPPLAGDLVMLQPPMLDLMLMNFRVDDSRARLPPAEGGLGYQPPWTTLQGVCHLVNEHLKGELQAEKL